MPSVEGLGARKAALRMLDAVLRKGQTLDSAAIASARDLSPPDRALAMAIAGETLRRLPDLDALIDSATRQRLPDDSKARMALRLALAQKIGLQHARPRCRRDRSASGRRRPEATGARRARHLAQGRRPGSRSATPSGSG